jgi:hypothetical protein
VAILGWIFAIGPRQIVITDTRRIPGGKPSVSTMKYLNPHYFGPLFAISAFASWKEIAGLPGFRQPAFRRRAKRFALGLSVFSTVVALAALSVLVPYSVAAGSTVASRPDFWARFLPGAASAVCYSALGLAIGLMVALMLSAADHAEPAATS